MYIYWYSINVFYTKFLKISINLEKQTISHKIDKLNIETFLKY